MAFVQSYVDPVGGSNATGDGTLAKPWATLQWAFDHCSRGANGNQVNLKSSGPQVNAASLSLTTFVAGGALSAAAPLIVRGYNAAANDSGIGEIDCGGRTMWAATNYGYVHLVDLDLHTFGNNHGIQPGVACSLTNCSVHKGASSPDGKYLVAGGATSGANVRISGCYIYDTGAGSCRAINTGPGWLIEGNYIDTTMHGIIVVGMNNGAILIGNIVKCSNTSSLGMTNDGDGVVWVIGNVFYNTAAGTLVGASLGSSTLRYAGVCRNNIAVGWSGVGGIGIGATNPGIFAYLVGHNAFYNCTTNYSMPGLTFIDETAHDVALAADPFTDAANGDFSLTAAAQTALRNAGWPAAYLGAHANTNGHMTIGPIQYGGGGGGGGMLAANKRGNKQ